MPIQQVYLSLGAREYTYKILTTETTGLDISADQYLLSLGTEITPGDFSAAMPYLVTDSPLPNQIEAKLLLGTGLNPDPGLYRVWRKISDSPEVLPKPTNLWVEVL